VGTPGAPVGGYPVGSLILAARCPPRSIPSCPDELVSVPPRRGTAISRGSGSSERERPAVAGGWRPGSPERTGTTSHRHEGCRESGGYCAPTSERAPAAAPKVGGTRARGTDPALGNLELRSELKAQVWRPGLCLLPHAQATSGALSISAGLLRFDRHQSARGLEWVMGACASTVEPRFPLLVVGFSGTHSWGGRHGQANRRTAAAELLGRVRRGHNVRRNSAPLAKQKK
jgi:hypothetical protein